MVETITDDGRIFAVTTAHAENELRDGGSKIIVMAHLGRPKGQVNWALLGSGRQAAVQSRWIRGQAKE